MEDEDIKKRILLALTDEPPLTFSQLREKMRCAHCDEVPESFRRVFKEMVYDTNELQVDWELRVRIPGRIYEKD